LGLVEGNIWQEVSTMRDMMSTNIIACRAEKMCPVMRMAPYSSLSNLHHGPMSQPLCLTFSDPSAHPTWLAFTVHSPGLYPKAGPQSNERQTILYHCPYYCKS
jgi:hypothetical protein